MKGISIIEHYKKLWFFNFNRLKGDNYGAMREYFARVVIREVEEFMPLEGRKVLDVGGARGEFCRVLSEERRCDAVNLDPSPYEYGRYSSEFLWPGTAMGRADDMPFDGEQFDLVICRGVLEHIPSERQQGSLNEMHRVVKVGGFCYVTVTPWYNPWAGHGLKPFHYLPFGAAKRLAEAAYGKRIDADSWEEKKLFPVTFRKMLRMISLSGFKIAGTLDTHFRMHFLTRIPVVREVAVPSVVFILTKGRNER